MIGLGLAAAFRCWCPAMAGGRAPCCRAIASSKTWKAWVQLRVLSRLERLPPLLAELGTTERGRKASNQRRLREVW